ncbi:MAG: lysylphosphatidylglycerol synthase transmembrane domain-containing protein [Candidatus Eiseniibacteriota bacterium]
MKRLRLGGQLAIGILFSAVLIWLSVRSIDPRDVTRALANANYWYFLPICALTLLAFWVRAIRWGWLLRSVKPIGPSSLFSATMIGFAANNLLPARLGELVRPWAIGRRERISRSSAFATVIVERVVDMFAILVLLGISLGLHPFPRVIKEAGFVALAINLGLLFFLIAIERNPAQAERFADWIARKLPSPIAPRAASLLRNFAAGLGVFRHGPGLLWVAFHTGVMFGVTALGLQACMWAFDLTVPWYAGLVLLVVTSFGIMVAPTPGYLGAMQYACVLGLSLFGVGKAVGFSFSLYYHLTQFLPITLVGLFYLGRQGLSLSQVAAASREEVSPSV